MRAELIKRLDVKRPAIRAWGKIPLPNLWIDGRQIQAARKAR